MRCLNLKNPADVVSFRQALFTGLGPDGGLYLPDPAGWPQLSPTRLDALLRQSRRDRLESLAVLLLADEFGEATCRAIAREALDFPIPLIEIEPGIGVLELFHGPTLAFKDVGARFMARCMAAAAPEGGGAPAPITILTATSGDTGSAVAQAFHGVTGVRVVILYPAGRISAVQEMQMVTLGDNVHALAVEGDFDDCQRLAKSAFEDPALRASAGLTTANSMNLGRLVPQSFYYFDAVAELRRQGQPRAPLISVPSGNFGNLTAGVLATRLGLPLAGLVAATNENDTVPRYLAGGAYAPAATVVTPSSAMDVAAPNNWPRIEALFGGDRAALATQIDAERVGSGETIDTIREVHNRTGYTLDPHGAVGYLALKCALKRWPGPRPPGVCLATAHPAKFNDVMREALGAEVELPERLAACLGRPRRGGRLDATPGALADYLRGL